MFRPMFDTGKGPAAASGARLAFTFDGRPLTGRAGHTVADALFGNGGTACRATPVSGAPRAIYCMMGICFECLVVIEGIGNRPGCLEPLRAVMRIATQHGRRQTGQAPR